MTPSERCAHAAARHRMALPRRLPPEQPSRPHEDRQGRGAEQHDLGDVFPDVVGADVADDAEDDPGEERSRDAPEPADHRDDQREGREREALGDRQRRGHRAGDRHEPREAAAQRED